MGNVYKVEVAMRWVLLVLVLVGCGDESSADPVECLGVTAESWACPEGTERVEESLGVDSVVRCLEGEETVAVLTVRESGGLEWRAPYDYGRVYEEQVKCDGEGAVALHLGRFYNSAGEARACILTEGTELDMSDGQASMCQPPT